jgi:hypothetical protein
MAVAGKMGPGGSSKLIEEVAQMVSTEFGFMGELEEEALELEPVFGQRFSWGGRSSVEFEGPSHEAIFDVACAGCPVPNCRPIVRQAILEAIKLANSAANKVEVATKVEPSKRDKDAKETARLFRAFFCHDPSKPIPWAGNEASGISVAKRFRAVAKELGGGRRMRFVCLPTKTPCPDTDLTCCDPTSNAWSLPGNSALRLCGPFWTDPHLPGLPVVDFRAAIHEMLHVLFGEFLGDQGKRANAHCYEVFLLRANGFGGDPADVTACGLC